MDGCLSASVWDYVGTSRGDSSAPAQTASSLIPSVKVIIDGTPVNSFLSEFPDLIRTTESSARCVTTSSTKYGLHQADQSPADNVG
jgi:hypothetical protein